MKQFILPNPPDHTGMIRLSGKDFHYLAHVRRIKPGAVFPGRLPTGETVQLRVRSVEADCIIAICTPPPASSSPPAGQVPIFLFQGMPKPPKMDLIVRQAAELGIAEIVPFICEYSPVKTERESERWNRIIREARQQSGSPVETVIAPPCALDALLARWHEIAGRYSNALGLLLHQVPLEPAGSGFHGCLAGNPGAVAEAVGPEGGFSPGETSRFLAAGFKALTAGTTILRTETAAMAAAATVRIILLERELWTLKIP
ncbi:MAG: 16S rRNA (uracil(1498)-N(3))-methyltransferase [Spirochaetaceae bacterium]|jgi:16S rRNA (uracil1498-N3)-methyltransferase|nr:16S rRNA (uracil(1498)-N(3))-methyltransferase [Spirochaetaceae bacterium]